MKGFWWDVVTGVLMGIVFFVVITLMFKFLLVK